MSITDVLLSMENEFTLPQAYTKIDSLMEVNHESIRARIYEGIKKGVLSRIAKGVFKNNNCLLIQGDGRNLSFLDDCSIDCIITDHPYDLKSNKGGSRNFANSYDCFKYTQKDFDEKARVLKNGCFLVEFLPEENNDNWEYIANIKMMAKKSGLEYYAQVPWKKGNFVSNCGRKSKNTENVMIFSKGKARCLRVDAKKDLYEPTVKHFMSGANGMLPTTFDFEKVSKQDTIHQAQKPCELLESIICYVTKPNEVILDSFAGSGVLGEACIKTNRKAILMETAEEFIIKIKSRLKLKPITI